MNPICGRRTKLQVRKGRINNSFDPQYEIPGRFFYVRYSQSF
jgi:hypothetical protein